MLQLCPLCLVTVLPYCYVVSPWILCRGQAWLWDFYWISWKTWLNETTIKMATGWNGTPDVFDLFCCCGVSKYGPEWGWPCANNSEQLELLFNVGRSVCEYEGIKFICFFQERSIQYSHLGSYIIVFSITLLYFPICRNTARCAVILAKDGRTVMWHTECLAYDSAENTRICSDPVLRLCYETVIIGPTFNGSTTGQLWWWWWFNNSCDPINFEKCPVSQETHCFYATRRFNTVYTRARHRSASWARRLQSPPSHPVSQRSDLILSSHLLLRVQWWN